MSSPVVVQPLAERDLREAQIWYEGKQPGLGAEFRASIGNVLQEVSSP